MTTSREQMLETIAAELSRHQVVAVDGRAQCKCGWYLTPLLQSVHRLHVAESVLAATLLATAQINGENIVAARDAAYDDAAKRTHAVGLLLANSGDITPTGTRVLDQIWETSERVNEARG